MSDAAAPEKIATVGAPPDQIGKKPPNYAKTGMLVTLFLRGWLTLLSEEQRVEC